MENRDMPEREASGFSPEGCIKAISEYDQELLVVALTGRAGADMKGVVGLLTGMKFKQALLQPPFTQGFEGSEDRDLRIIQRFIRERWKPFAEVSVNAVMLTFLLDCKKEERGKYSFGVIFEKSSSKQVDPFESLEKILQENTESLRSSCVERLRSLDGALDVGCGPGFGMEDFPGFMKGKLDSLLGGLSLDGLRDKWLEAKGRLERRDFGEYETVAVCFGLLPSLTDMLEKKLDSLEKDLFALVYQRLGNEIRAYGRPFAEGLVDGESHLFDLPQRTVDFCHAVRHYCQSVGKDGRWTKPRNPARIVLHSLKNPFEAFYLKQRFPNFYLVSISRDNDSRTTLYSDRDRTMGYVEMGESPAVLRDAISKVESAGPDGKWESLERADAARLDAEARRLGIGKKRLKYAVEVHKNERLRYECYENGTHPFVLQDVMSCTEAADVFVTRDAGENIAAHDYRLLRSLARFAVLAMHPGLLKPTKVERCMQIALSAKLNSGCLSRQVGAVVTDAEFNILSLGWNDAPCGSEVCARRNFLDVAAKYDRSAYSNFELNDPAFREYMECAEEQYRLEGGAGKLRGLPAAYCFKDVYQDIISTRDQIHTRALHGEERALAACGNERAKGGYLFTTSSPCELCAKKAKEAGIRRIYYIERYKGISHEHIIDEGPVGRRAEYAFFAGAVGCAYTRLYTPAVPYKDELGAMGMTPKQLKGRRGEGKAHP